MRIIFLLLFLVSCGGGETVFVPVATQQPEPQSNYPDPEPFPDEPEPLPEDEGQALYLAKCASCHGKNPDIAGADAAQIKEALRTVRPMFNVKASSDEQQKIGIFLTDLARGNNQGEGDDDVDGDSEYE
jgi:hypothetical protein